MNIQHGTISKFASLFVITLTLAKPAFADSSSDETRRVILELFDAFNRHDVEGLVALYSDKALLRSPGDAEPGIGQDVIRATYAGHFDNIPGVHDTVQNVVAEGNNGAVEFIATWDQPTTEDPDARGSLRIASFITIENGKIVKDITYFDRVELTENMVPGNAE